MELLGVEFYGFLEPRVLSLGQPTPSPVPRIGALCADRRGVKSHALMNVKVMGWKVRMR